MARKKTESEQSFEQIMDELELLVEKLESGEEGLEAALDIYASGVGLVGKARQKLETVENRIKELEAAKKSDESMIIFNTGNNNDE